MDMNEIASTDAPPTGVAGSAEAREAEPGELDAADGFAPAAGERPLSRSEPKKPIEAGESDQPEGSPFPLNLPRLQLAPYRSAPSDNRRANATGAPTKRNATAIGLAASLVLLVLVSGAGLANHYRQSALLTQGEKENQSLAQSLGAMKARLDAIEASRSRDETAELKKILSEVKSGASAARDFNGALAQLSSRIDHIERDQGARLDKIGDRIDHDSAARFSDLTSRLDKLEKKGATSTLLPVGPPPPANPTVSMLKATPAVSNETTGSIDRTKVRIKNLRLVDVRDGYAIIDGQDGPQSVAPGDLVPSAGRVLRIERRGRDWVVVTSGGFIQGDWARQ